MTVLLHLARVISDAGSDRGERGSAAMTETETVVVAVVIRIVLHVSLVRVHNFLRISCCNDGRLIVVAAV